MTQVVRSTLAGTNLENPGRPQQENRGGSPQDVLAQVLFSTDDRAREAALLQIEATLSEIRQKTPPLVTKNTAGPTIEHPQRVYQSAYVPEVTAPQQPVSTAVETPAPKSFLGLFNRQKSAAQLFQERQARRKAA